MCRGIQRHIESMKDHLLLKNIVRDREIKWEQNKKRYCSYVQRHIERHIESVKDQVVLKYMRREWIKDKMRERGGKQVLEMNLLQSGRGCVPMRVWERFSDKFSWKKREVCLWERERESVNGPMWVFVRLWECYSPSVCKYRINMRKGDNDSGKRFSA